MSLQCQLVSIFLMTLFGRSATLLRTLEGVLHWSGSSVCKSIFALEEHCTKVVSYVHDVLCSCIGASLVHRFQQICKINTQWQGEIDHNIFFNVGICSKIQNNFCSVLAFVKDCGHVLAQSLYLGKMYLSQVCFDRSLLQQDKQIVTVSFLLCRKNLSSICHEFDT